MAGDAANVDELRCMVEPEQRVREVVGGGPVARAASSSAASSRFGDRRTCTKAAAIGAKTYS